MANGEDSNAPIDPLSGRIIGAGSNNLQRSVDSLNFTLQRLMAVSGAGGMGGGGGGRPPVVTSAASPMEPRNNGGGALVLRGQVVARREERFPRAATWDSQENGYDYQWGTPVRNASGNQLPGNQSLARTGISLLNSFPRPAPPPSYTYGAANQVGGNSGGGGGFNWRNAAWNGRRISNRIGAWGAGLVKTGSVMDTYSQWAGIANAAPYSADGTNGGSVNAIRKFGFGSQGQNLTGWAQNAKDAQAALFTASRNSGFTELTPGTRQTVNPAWASYLGNVKDLSILNPTLDAAQTASMLGTLTSTRGLYAAQMYGYRPLLSPGGRVDRGALGGFADSVLQRTFNRTSIRPEELKASLGQNGSLHANIAAYVRSAGGDDTMAQGLEDYVTGRNTAQQRGLSGAEFDKLLSDYESGGSAGKAAEKRLQRFGVSNTILQSQKDLSAAKTGNISDLMDSLGPAVKRANEALETFYNWLNDIVNLPGVKQSLGTVAGWGSVFGPAVGSAFGAMAGMRLGGGALGAAGSLLGLRSVGGAGAGGGLLAAAGGQGALLRGGAYGLGAVGVNAAGNAAADNISNPGARRVAKYLTTVGTWGLAGAGVGSVVPVVGTGLGAAIGTGVGAVKGLWDGFHDDSATGNDGIGGGGPDRNDTKGSSASSGEPIAGKSAAGAISATLAELGKPYEWGGVGPDAFDCSGLMRWAYRKIGVELPRVSQDQMRAGKEISSLKDARPGDLLFPYPGHVAMYLGNGKLVEAPRPGKNVRVAPTSEYGKYQAIRRIVGSVGSYSGAAEQDANTQQSQTGNAGGDPGSRVLSSDSGSTEEVDAITAAMAGAKHTLLNGPMGNSSSSASNDSSAPDLSGVDISGPYKKDSASIQKAKAVGKGLAASMYNWTGPEWDALHKLWVGESNWRWWAENPSSGAYGIPQSLPASKLASAGKDWKTNPATQIKWGLKYIKERYGDPIKAYGSWKSRSPHWYDTGAWDIPEDQPAIVHKGEMIIEKPKADTIRQALMRDVVNVKSPSGAASGGSGGGGITLNFQNGSVVFSVTGGATESMARGAADTFARALAENARLKALAEGL